jgi:lipid-binding SYLF domain-containing protein
MKIANTMKSSIRALTVAAVMAAATLTVAQADDASADSSAKSAVKYQKAVSIFRHAGKSGAFFHHSYAYAVFPTVGEGAFIVGGAGGKGGVFVNGVQTGDATVAQVSVGFQAGGKAYSEIIFFETKSALDEFESGNFEFGADASVTAITANADVSAGTDGTEAGASGGEHDAKTAGHYYKGMAVFTVAKGGLMYQAAVAGQKFTYHPFS